MRTVAPAPASTPVGLLLTRLSVSSAATEPPARRAASPAVQLSDRLELRMDTVVPSAVGRDPRMAVERGQRRRGQRQGEDDGQEKTSGGQGSGGPPPSRRGECTDGVDAKATFAVRPSPLPSR